MKITFFGAAGEVTGSQHLIECSGLRVLLDCGLFQGHRIESRAKNERLECHPADLDAVILSHAHIDHCGNLPSLYRAGFRGPIYCTEATADVASFMLQDAAKIQEEDARHLNKHRNPAAPSVEPLYTPEHAQATLKLMEPLSYHGWHTLAPELRIRFSDAGHILGSAITQMEFQERADTRRVVFTGDLGRRGLPVLRDPELISEGEILITESTYADRVHPSAEDQKEALLRLVQEVYQRGGKLIIPAFSLGRTQNIVYYLNQLHNEGRLPRLPVYVDSPLSRKITGVYRHHGAILNSNVQRTLMSDEDPFGFPGLTYVASQGESMALNHESGPMVIIAASGMCESGRVLHHLKHSVSDPKNMILIIGFQAEGTLGRRIVERRPFLRILNREYPLNARVEKLNGFSAHADAEDFGWWCGHLGRNAGISQAFIVHGEGTAAQAMGKLLQDFSDHPPIIPQRFQSFDL